MYSLSTFMFDTVKVPTRKSKKCNPANNKNNIKIIGISSSSLFELSLKPYINETRTVFKPKH